MYGKAIQTILVEYGADDLLDKYQTIKFIDLKVVNIILDGKVVYWFWVTGGAYVLCSLSQLVHHGDKFRELKSLVRSLNLRFHPDKYNGPLDTSHLKGIINLDPTMESIARLVNVLSMGGNRVAPHGSQLTRFNIECYRLDNMYYVFKKNTIGMDFFQHASVVEVLGRYLTPAMTNLLSSGTNCRIRAIVSAMLTSFIPTEISTLNKQVGPSSKEYDDVMILITFVKRVHKMMGGESDWIGTIQNTLVSFSKDTTVVAEVEDENMEVDDEPEPVRRPKRKQPPIQPIRRSKRLVKTPIRRSTRLAMK